MLTSFESFLNDNALIIIVVFFALVLLIIYLLRKFVLSKYQEPEKIQTQEEIVKEELDRILITEEYKPIPKKKKKKKIEDDEIIETDKE